MHCSGKEREGDALETRTVAGAMAPCALNTSAASYMPVSRAGADAAGNQTASDRHLYALVVRSLAGAARVGGVGSMAPAYRPSAELAAMLGLAWIAVARAGPHGRIATGLFVASGYLSALDFH